MKYETAIQVLSASVRRFESNIADCRKNMENYAQYLSSDKAKLAQYERELAEFKSAIKRLGG